MGATSETVTTVTFTCDNPACKFGKDSPTVLQWCSEKVQEDVQSLPARAWRIIRITLFDTRTVQFCGIECARHWLAYIEPLNPPALQEPVVSINSHPDFPGNFSKKDDEVIAG